MGKFKEEEGLMSLKITEERLYTSHLKEKRVWDSNGWSKLVPVNGKPEPTGDFVFDKVAACLAKETNCTLEKLAQMTGIPRKSMEIYFRDVGGITLGAFLRGYNTLVALEFLKCSNLRAKAIAELTGCSLHQLNRRVKAKTGLTPLQYRFQERPKDYQNHYRY